MLWKNHSITKYNFILQVFALSSREVKPHPTPATSALNKSTGAPTLIQCSSLKGPERFRDQYLTSVKQYPRAPATVQAPEVVSNRRASIVSGMKRPLSQQVTVNTVRKKRRMGPKSAVLKKGRSSDEFTPPVTPCNPASGIEAALPVTLPQLTDNDFEEVAEPVNDVVPTERAHIPHSVVGRREAEQEKPEDQDVVELEVNPKTVKQSDEKQPVKQTGGKIPCQNPG